MTDAKGGRSTISRFLDDRILQRVQRLQPIASDLGLEHGAAGGCSVLANDNIACAIVGALLLQQVVDNAAAAGSQARRPRCWPRSTRRRATW